MSERLNGFILGTALTSIIAIGVYTFLEAKRGTTIGQKMDDSKSKQSINQDADDNCMSLFYGKVPGNEGSGFPYDKAAPAVDTSTMNQLTTVHPEYRRLPREFYNTAVETLPIVCVDVILCRRHPTTGKQELLLFYRRDAPARGIWWWPGGRMFRGETFFSTAMRKIRDETGQQDVDVAPVAVLQVWNTFFPDSSWDAQRQPGREGTHTVNVAVFCELRSSNSSSSGSNKGDLNLMNQEAKEQWAVEAHRWVSVSEALQSRKFDKYVTLNVKLAIEKGLLVK